MDDRNQTICLNCGRVFRVWDVTEKKCECPFCNAKGDNPYYRKPEKISQSKMFVKLSK